VVGLKEQAPYPLRAWPIERNGERTKPKASEPRRKAEAGKAHGMALRLPDNLSGNLFKALDERGRCRQEAVDVKDL
jgi:hypothetical protein